MDNHNYHLHITGIVQGVGFRPTVYLLAQKHKLFGSVLNSSNGVEINIHGTEADCQAFIAELRRTPPALAKIDSFDVKPAALQVFTEFQIIESHDDPGGFLPVSPDLAICADCRRELLDPSNRRFRYPFINCTNCGPRFSIVKTIPYDRPNTTMADFKLCPQCAAEYTDPTDRRFHAQPIACAVCGPQVWFEQDGKPVAIGEQAILLTRQAITAGKIVAVKGLGGFHLVCNAADKKAVSQLRLQKQRTGKPFALMAYSLDIVEKYCQLQESEMTLLNSAQAPIVLLNANQKGRELAQIVAPDQNRLGFMLPYTPLHLLLLEPQEGFPEVLVMTSGNLSEEPIAYENADALKRLSPLADAFLMHNRPIYMRVDDSVVTTLRGKTYPIRRARGYAPGQLRISHCSQPILAAGTHLKNTFCLARDNYAFVSHYIGDLENEETLASYEQAVRHYEALFRIKPEVIACDAHPDYLATRYAITRSKTENLPLIPVQHHHAHIAACLAENDWKSAEPVIGLSFDGTGYGTDGKIWGGEIFIAGYTDFERRFHLAEVPLPGGDMAVLKPARMAISYLMRAGIETAGTNLLPVQFLENREYQAVAAQVQSGLNSPYTSSMGRLFDAVASILGICHEISYEAQAAIALETIADPDEEGIYELPLEADKIDTLSLMRQIVRDWQIGIPASTISARFHNSLITMATSVCGILRKEHGLKHVAISGGVWQNLYLMNRILPALEKEGFIPLYHSLFPPNDACVSLGQVMVASYRAKQGVKQQ